MSTIINLSQEELHSALADMHNQEGVLICKGEQAAWDEMAIGRAFSTFLFSPSPSDTDGSGLSFCHDDTGTIVNYQGRVLTIECGSNGLLDAMGDLLLVLNALGWVDIDVYSVHGDAFFNDLAERIPARIANDINMELQEPPEGVGADEMAAFSASVSAAQSGAVPVSSANEFLEEFRRGENLAPAAPPAQAELASAESPVRRVISLNTPSPVSAPAQAPSPALSSSAIAEQPIAQPYGANSLDLPIPQPIPDDNEDANSETAAAELPLGPSETAMRVADTPKLGVGITQLAVPSPSPSVNAPGASSTASPSATDSAPATESRVVVPEPDVVRPAPASTMDAPATKAPLAAAPAAPTIDIGQHSIRIGSAMFVRLAPGEEIPEADFAVMKAQLTTTGPLKVIRCGLRSADSQEARRWQPFHEIPVGFDGPGYFDATRIIARSLWPALGYQGQMLATALLLAARGDASDEATPGNLQDVYDIATRGVAGGAEGVADALYPIEVRGFPAKQLTAWVLDTFKKVAPVSALVEVSASLLPLLFEDPEDALASESGWFSLAGILNSGTPTLVIVQHDSLDYGGLNELLSAGFWAFVSAVKLSGRYAGVKRPEINIQTANGDDDDKPITRGDLMKMLAEFAAKQPKN